MSRTQLKPYYGVKMFFLRNHRLKFFTAKCCYQLKEAGNALSKENAVVSVTSNDRNTVWHLTFRRQWQIHAPELVIIKPHSDVCYICDKHYEALLRRGGGHPPFAECKYSCCGSC